MFVFLSPGKMFKKLMAVSATVAIAATMSVSAFAAGETATHTDGSVSVSGYAAVDGATQYTVMLFEDSFTTDYAVSKIFYINQDSNPSTLLSNMLVKATDGVNALPVGDYTVRIGNDAGDAIDVDLKVVAAEEDPETVELVFGDVDGNGVVNATDAGYIASFFTGATGSVGSIYAIGETVEDGILFGDVDGNGVVNATDAGYVASFFTGATGSVGASVAIGDPYTVPAK